MGDSYRVMEGERLVYEHLGRSYEPRERREIQPSAERWAEFWAAMNEAGVWAWEARYEPPDPVMDGTSWSLVLDDGTGRVESSGSNAAPAGMRAVREVLSRLAADAPFH